MGQVSVIIPVFNGAQHVSQAIDSVLQQTYRPIEVIAVNDGSTDESARVLSTFEQRITVIQQPNNGVAAARNAGIANSTGEFVAFLDQDDSWRPTKVAEQVCSLQSDDDMGLVHTGVAFLDQESGGFLPAVDLTLDPASMVGACYHRLLFGNPIVNSSVMIRASILDMVGGCDLQIQGNTCQDYDLWLRASEVTSFGYIQDKLTVFRVHQSQGQKNRRAMVNEELKVLLRRHPRSFWLETPRGRARLANLYDELATAHFDAGEARLARQYFSKALAANPSGRQLARFGTSCLPFKLATTCRLVARSLKSRKRKRNWTAGAKLCR